MSAMLARLFSILWIVSVLGCGSTPRIDIPKVTSPQASSHPTEPATQASETDGAATDGAATNSTAKVDPLVANFPWLRGDFRADPQTVVERARVLSDADDASVVVLLEEQRVRIAEDHTHKKTYHLLYRVQREAGLEGWSSLSWTWNPWYQARPIVRARVYSPDGEIHDLDPTVVTDGPAAKDDDTYDERRVVRARIPAMQVGVVVEQVVEVDERRPFFTAGHVERRYCGYRAYPTLCSRLEIDRPSAIAVRYRAELLPDLEVDEQHTGERVITRFSHRRIAPIGRGEDRLPSDTIDYPYICYTDGESWQPVARAYHDIVEQQLAGAQLDDLAASIVGSATTPKEKTDLCLAWMRRNLTYVSLTLSNVGLTPRRPAEVIETKYGDCKDNATLLCGLLRASGASAYVAAIDTGPGFDVDRELAGLGLFDHAIVYVASDPPFWVDPTDDATRAGELPLQDQGRRALIARPESTELVDTPIATSMDNRVVETRRVHMVVKGNSVVQEVTTYFGYPARDMRRSYFDSDPKAVTKTLSDYVAKTYTAQAGLCSVSDPYDFDTPFRLDVNGSSAHACFSDGDAAVANLNYWAVFDQLPDALTDEEPKARRKSDYEFWLRHRRELHCEIQPPPHYELRQLPESEVVELGPARLERRYEVAADGTIEAHFVFEISKRRLSPAELDALHRGIYDLYNGNTKVAIYFDEIGTKLWSAGKYRAALDFFRRCAEENDNELFYAGKIGDALLEIGLGDRARELAEMAVHNHRESAAAYHQLGCAYTRDPIARLRAPGFDQALSLAALERAHEFEPDTPLFSAELAIALEYDNRGTRYAESCDLERATKLYSAALAGLPGVLPNLKQNLNHRDAYDELLQLTAKRKDLDSAGCYLYALARTKGVDAAVAESLSRLPQSSARSQALRAAGANAVIRRDYSTGVALYSASLADADAASRGQTESSIRRVVRTTRIAHDFDPKRLDHIYLSFVQRLAGHRVDDLTGIITPEFQRELRANETLRRDVFAAHERLMGSGNLDYCLDLLAANVALSPAGDDTRGYRITARFGSITQQIFVCKEADEYRVAAMLPDDALLGYYALTAFDADRLDVARQWLDWAREAYRLPVATTPALGQAFAAAWPLGESAPKETILRAALLLSVGLRSDTKALDRLLAALRDELQAGGPTVAAQHFELARQLRDRERFADALTHFEAAFSPIPDAVNPLAMGRLHASLLTSVGRWDDAAAVLSRLQREDPTNPIVSDLSANLLTHRGELDAAYRVAKASFDERPSPQMANTSAWLSLFAEDADRRAAIAAARWGIKNADVSQVREVQHTLAAVLAMAGKCKVSYDTLVASIPNQEEPSADDWVVIGLIAERVGEVDAARRAYARVLDGPQRERANPVSPARLASLRLDAMAASPPAEH